MSNLFIIVQKLYPVYVQKYWIYSIMPTKKLIVNNNNSNNGPNLTPCHICQTSI